MILDEFSLKVSAEAGPLDLKRILSGRSLWTKVRVLLWMIRPKNRARARFVGNCLDRGVEIIKDEIRKSLQEGISIALTQGGHVASAEACLVAHLDDDQNLLPACIKIKCATCGEYIRPENLDDPCPGRLGQFGQTSVGYIETPDPEVKS